MIRNRYSRATVAVFAALALMTTVTTAAASASITGAGSTLVAPILANWKSGFERGGGTGVQYSPVGSGAGIAQITARTVDFGASDAPLTREQANSCNSCVQIPWALSATGIGYNLPVRGLKLTGPVLAEIYLGKIKKWNDRRIKRINKGKRLPGLKITPIFRNDGSGDTYAFTDYLSRVSGQWKRKVGFATSVGFPTGVGAKGNLGLTNTLKKTRGAIAYISVSYLIAAGSKVAAIQNRAKRYVFPNLKNIANAASIVKRVPSSNTVSIADPPRKAKIAYPLSTFTYAIVPKSSSKKGEIKSFITYALTKGQRFGAALNFPPLPKVVLRAAKRANSRL